MHRPSPWSRIALTSSALALSALACDSVLDIEEPSMRPSEAGAGAGGEPDGTGNGGTPSAGGTAPGSGGNSAGEAGTTAGGSGLGGLGGEGGLGGDGGSGGDPQFVPKDCEPKELRCGGDGELTPQICDDTGHWVQNTAEADAACPLLCASGRCVECGEEKKRCSVCEEGDATCNPNQPQKCLDGAWQNDGALCDSHCDGGGCVAAPSCDPLFKTTTTCGTESCCTSLPVAGGTFKRSYDESDDFGDDTHPATVSSFLLDKFEVTVGRMRRFANAYNETKAKLKDGWGKSAYLLGDEGWNSGTPMPADRAALISELKCDDAATWSELDNEDLPINCVSFAVAYAFCLWDGGRLPTEAEWNFAAAGGSEQRAYPWKAGPGGPALTTEHANYGTAGPIVVGSKPAGAGRWGQLDLAGNLAEWTLDYYASYSEECDNCFNSTPSSARTYRGGSYASDEFTTLVSNRSDLDPSSRRPFIGFRCARELM